MEPTSLKKADPLQILLITLQFLALMGMVFALVFAPHFSFNFFMSFFFFMGLSSLYTGIKRVYQERKQRQHFFWYKQPFILVGVALLLDVLYFFLEEFISPRVAHTTTVDVVIAVVLFPVSFIFLIAAFYFLFRGQMQRHQQPERRKTDTPLRQTARSRPQPKEAREE